MGDMTSPLLGRIEALVRAQVDKLVNDWIGNTWGEKEAGDFKLNKEERKELEEMEKEIMSSASSVSSISGSSVSDSSSESSIAVPSSSEEEAEFLEGGKATGIAAARKFREKEAKKKAKMEQEQEKMQRRMERKLRRARRKKFVEEKLAEKKKVKKKIKNKELAEKKKAYMKEREERCLETWLKQPPTWKTKSCGMNDNGWYEVQYMDDNLPHSTYPTTSLIVFLQSRYPEARVGTNKISLNLSKATVVTIYINRSVTSSGNKRPGEKSDKVSKKKKKD